MNPINARMRYLRNAEAICAFALPIVFCYYWARTGEPVAWALRGAALAVVSYILLQGALYWQLKLQSFARHRQLPACFPALYQVFKYSNIVAIGAVGAAMAWMSATSLSPVDLAWTSGLLAFAILEQINYYHVQLMYDSAAALRYLRRNGRLRQAALALDLKCARQQQSPATIAGIGQG